MSLMLSGSRDTSTVLMGKRPSFEDKNETILLNLREVLNIITFLRASFEFHTNIFLGHALKC